MLVGSIRIIVFWGVYIGVPGHSHVNFVALNDSASKTLKP